MTRSYLILLILSCCILLTSPRAWSQSVTTDSSTAEALGDHLYNLEQYKPALKEYLRAYYYDRAYQNKFIERKTSICFQKLEDWDNAIKYQKKYSERKDLKSHEKQLAYYELLQMAFTNEGPKSALIILYGLPNDIIDIDKDKYHYYEALISLASEKYDDAILSINSLSYHAEINSTDVNGLIKELKKNASKNHNVARWMSSILPGTGQMANGEIWDGTNSALITFAFLYWTLHISRTLSPIDGLMSVGPWFARFYGGGLSNATAASKKKQNRKAKELLTKFNSVIIKAKSAHNSKQLIKPPGI